MREAAPREFQIRHEDAERHGYTRGCPGCTSWFRGLGRQPHNEGCRGRFRDVMREEGKVKRARGQKDEFQRKVQAKRAKKERKREAERKTEDEPKEENEGGEEEAEEGREADEEGDKDMRERPNEDDQEERQAK